MSLIEQTHAIADLVKKSGDVELHRKIIRLEEEIIELSRRAHKLELENDRLSAILSTKQGLKYEEPFFVETASSARKCCPHCWQHDQRTVFVVGGNDRAGNLRFDCPTCRRFFIRYHGQEVWDVGIDK